MIFTKFVLIGIINMILFFTYTQYNGKHIKAILIIKGTIKEPIILNNAKVIMIYCKLRW